MYTECFIKSFLLISVIFLIIKCWSNNESFTNTRQIEKLDKTNCVWGRIPSPGASGSDYKYIGNFDTLEQCAASPNIDPKAKAITHHGKNSGAYSRQCYSINDIKTRKPNQNDTTCGIRKSALPEVEAAERQAAEYERSQKAEAERQRSLGQWNIKEKKAPSHYTNIPLKSYEAKTLDECKDYCRKLPKCAGFRRISNDWVSDNDKSFCDLLHNVRDNSLKEDNFYDIYEKK